jgi:hypothetical protein
MLAICSTPEGVAAISRGLSAATPPVMWLAIRYRPRRGRSRTAENGVGAIDRRSHVQNQFQQSEALAPLRGAVPFSIQIRGYRFAQSPANRWHPCQGATASEVNPSSSPSPRTAVGYRINSQPMTLRADCGKTLENRVTNRRLGATGLLP